MGVGDTFKSKAKSMANDLIGNNSHAVVMVWDYRKKLAETQKTGETQAGSLASMGKKLLKGGAVSAMLPKDVADTVKTYSVQFNPSTLRVTAHSDPAVHGSVTGETNPSSTTSATTPPTLELQVSLIFDRVNIADAFIGDKFSTFTSAQAISNLATVATKLGGDTPWTVKPEVEAFVAALRNPATRTISFVWKNFEFNGVLKNVNAEYTMFAPSGRPVRAKVGLRISQLLNEANQTYWENCFDDTFKGSGGALSLTKLF